MRCMNVDGYSLPLFEIQRRGGRKVQAFVGAYRRLEDEGYRRVQEAGVYRPVSPHSNLGLLEYLTSWVSSQWASGIHVVAMLWRQSYFCDCPGTSHVRAS